MLTDSEYQLECLTKIFDDGLLAPVFKRNPKFPISRDDVPRIKYGDVMDGKFVIRRCPVDDLFGGNTLWDQDAEVIVEYMSIEDLVGDGWRLD